MNYEIPVPLKQEHEALHDQLRQATQAGGEVGELAETLALLMHPHFVKEDQIALPPLGLLTALRDCRLRAATDAACAHRRRGDVPGGDPGRQVRAAAPGPTLAGGRLRMKPSQRELVT